MRTVTKTEYMAEGVALFGPDPMGWRFVCPSCGNTACTKDWKDAGAPEGSVAYSCVGRWMPGTTATLGEKDKGFCNYAGGGLFGLNPVKVMDGDKEHHVFEFERRTASSAAA